MEQVTAEALYHQLEEVKSLLAQSHINAVTEHSREMWSVADIARYFKYTKRHIRAAVICDPYFPEPVKLASQRDPKKITNHLRWFAGDVVRYAEKKKR